MIRPYPQKWPRVLDFLTPLGLQAALDKNLELYHCQAVVSMQRSKIPSEPIKTDLGVINIDTTSRDRVVWESGSPEPKNEVTPTQKEILNNIADNLSIDFPDIAIKRRGVVEKVPKSLDYLEAFEGAENIFYQQTAYGNYTHLLRNKLGLPLRNPYRFMKGELLAHRIVKSSRDPVFKRIRSTLKTNWVKTDVSGYSTLGKINIFQLGKALATKKWWQDIGLVHPVEAQIDHSVFEGNIYRLWKRKQIIAV